MSTPFSWPWFHMAPVVGVLRGFTLAQVMEIVPAAIRGGLRNIEITMNTTEAAQQIRDVTAMFEGQINIGAGTVVSLPLLEQALSVGASFVVTPTIQQDVINACVGRSVPIFPGAFTPTEIERAWDLGASLVKVFPAETGGPKYIRALKGPFPQIKLLPTGGVDLKTLSAFVEAGADGFGVGSPLFDRRRVEEGDWKWVEDQCRAFATGYREILPLSDVCHRQAQTR